MSVAAPHQYQAVANLMFEVVTGEGYGDMREPMSAVAVAERWAGLGTLLVALNEEDAVIGTVTMALPPSRLIQIAQDDEAEVRLLAVAACARRAGIGRALTEHCIALARAAGKRALVLSTQRTMLGAQRLYDALGFQRTPQIDRMENGREFLAYRFDLRP